MSMTNLEESTFTNFPSYYWEKPGWKKKIIFFEKTRARIWTRNRVVLATVLIRKDLNGLLIGLELLFHLSAGFSPVSLPKHKLSNPKLMKWERKEWLPPPGFIAFAGSSQSNVPVRVVFSLSPFLLSRSLTPSSSTRLPPLPCNATETPPRISEKQNKRESFNTGAGGRRDGGTLWPLSAHTQLFQPRGLPG